MNRKNNCSSQVAGSSLRPSARFARLLTVICTLSIGIAATAQNFTIKRVELEGDLVNIYYDLMDTTARRTYTVNLFSSRDNFITALEKVSGDMGLEVKPGPNRKISWNTREELGNAFEGEVSLEIRGR